MNYDPIKPSIIDEHIASPAEDKHWQASRFRELKCFGKLDWIGQLDKIPSRSADLKGRERFERAILFDGKQLG